MSRTSNDSMRDQILAALRDVDRPQTTREVVAAAGPYCNTVHPVAGCREPERDRLPSHWRSHIHYGGLCMIWLDMSSGVATSILRTLVNVGLVERSGPRHGALWALTANERARSNREAAALLELAGGRQ